MTAEPMALPVDELRALELDEAVLANVFPQSFLVAVQGDGLWLTYPEPMIVREEPRIATLSFASPLLGCHNSCTRLEFIRGGAMSSLWVYRESRPQFETPRTCSVAAGDCMSVHLKRGEKRQRWRTL